MIKKLRKKFIWINMILVTLVLLIVFTAVCISSSHRITSETRDALHFAMEMRIEESPPKLEIGKKPGPKPPVYRIPVFSVLLDENGNLISSMRENVALSDDVLDEAINIAFESKQDEGVIRSLDLRFLKMNTERGIKFAFADRSNEIESMQSIILISLIVGAGGLLAFFIISLFLSGWALRPVQKAWNQQKQFVADASHELKTPLTVILANIGIIRSHPKDTIDQQIKWVNNTQEEAVRMKKLVDDLLFLAKSDANRTPLTFSEVNLSDIVWSCLLPFESVAFEKGVTLEENITPELKISGNIGQLKQLIVILIDNACKYADTNTAIKISFIQEQNAVSFKINNKGTVISEEEQPYIFERFYRVEESRARDQGGYGLGLAIAKQIVTNHNGSISVKSNEKEGTTFTVQF